MTLQLSPNDTPNTIVNRYPIAAGYLASRNWTGENLNTPLSELLRSEELSLNEFKSELRTHLQKAVRPDLDECNTISCKPLPFCPDEISLDLISHTINTLKRILLKLVKLIPSQYRKIYADVQKRITAQILNEF